MPEFPDPEARRAARSYFLGSLPSEEATRLEVGVMADADFAERMLAAEAELIEDYLDGSLDARERGLFESVYMAVPEREARVRFAQDLARRAGARRVEGGGLSRVLLAIAATVVIAFGARLAMLPEAPSPKVVRGETPPLPAATPSVAPAADPGVPRTPRSVVFALALGMSRGQAPAPLVVPKGIEVVDLEIDLEGETRFPEFEARLTDAQGREIWRSPSAEPLRPRPDGVLMIRIPVSEVLRRASGLELALGGRPVGARAVPLARMPLPLAIP